MRYLISGGRFFRDKDAIWNVVDDFDCVFDVAIHGACHKGADHIADERLKKWGTQTLRFPANWSLGRAGGHIRNQQMIDEGKPDFAYFFWDGMSPGTRDCLVRVLKARIPHEVVAQTGCKEYVSEGYLDAIARAFPPKAQGALF